MPNVLKKERQIAIISGLAEGMSMRALSRVTDVHQDTIWRLAVRVGQGCARLLDERLRNLECHYWSLTKFGDSSAKRKVFQGQTVWEGEVEVFDLPESPEANRIMLGRTRQTM